MRTAADIATLGIGRFDGEEAFIPLGNNDGAELTWNLPALEWRSEEHEMFLLHSVEVRDQNIGANDWEYLYKPAGNPGQFNRSDYGWEPSLISSPAAAYSAGLRLQENISMAGNADATSWQLATVHYEFDQNDTISGAIDPDAHIGVVLDLPTSSVWASSGWEDSAIPTPSKATLAPHLYTRYTVTSGGMVMKAIKVDWRWAGTP